MSGETGERVQGRLDRLGITAEKAAREAGMTVDGLEKLLDGRLASVRGRSGLCLITKRLETGAFTWPPVRDGAVTLNAAQLRLLFTGMDWTRLGAVPVPAE